MSSIGDGFTSIMQKFILRNSSTIAMTIGFLTINLVIPSIVRAMHGKIMSFLPFMIYGNLLIVLFFVLKRDIKFPVGLLSTN
jgi:hypothetical protein